MLVYGDRSSLISPMARLADIAALLRPGPVGRSRHDQLVRALIEAGELAQGLADAEFNARQVDDHTPLQAAALALATILARKVGASWKSSFAEAGPSADRDLAKLTALAPTGAVRCKQAEGFAHYAVYPEAYFEAARELQGSAPLVIGVRSIGATLGAVVAAATEAPCFVTLRPHGHPFDRQVSVSEGLRALLATHQGLYVIVDEGPGLSGSSFGAVADLLESMGIADRRVAFMPSHGAAPGPQAPKRRLARWSRSRRPFRTLDDLAPAKAIAGWFEDIVGEADRVDDLSHGGWRRDLPPVAWPPVWPGLERRKLRLTTGSGVYLARFAGLGACGEEKLRMARLLTAGEFTAEPLSLRHGFLLERWLPGAPPTPAQVRSPVFQRRVGAYLDFRARLSPSEPPGADLDELTQMAQVNAAEACGEALSLQVGARVAALMDAAKPLRSISIDGRLHAWEWRCGPDGSIHKTDALDHAHAHDLIGCQDPAWDVAGAAVELGLTAPETDALVRSVTGVSPAAVDLFRGLYCAFQAGVWTMAAAAAPSPADARRAHAQVGRYVCGLRRWIARAVD